MKICRFFANFGENNCFQAIRDLKLANVSWAQYAHAHKLHKFVESSLCACLIPPVSIAQWRDLSSYFAKGHVTDLPSDPADTATT